MVGAGWDHNVLDVGFGEVGRQFLVPCSPFRFFEDPLRGSALGSLRVKVEVDEDGQVVTTQKRTYMDIKIGC